MGSASNSSSERESDSVSGLSVWELASDYTPSSPSSSSSEPEGIVAGAESTSTSSTMNNLSALMVEGSEVGFNGLLPRDCPILELQAISSRKH